VNEPPPSDGRGRILVVEDNPSDLQYLLKVLQERGYTVHPASDARLALRFVETTVPDLVLLDSMLPGSLIVLMHTLQCILCKLTKV